MIRLASFVEAGRSSPNDTVGGMPGGRRGTWVLGACALGVLLSFVQVGATAPADIRIHAMKSVFNGDRTNLGDPGPSLAAARLLQETPHAPIYQNVGSEGAAFIYPPVAAFFYLPVATSSPSEARDFLVLVNRVLLVGIGLLALALLRSRQGAHWGETFGGVAVLLVFYPLLRAVELNQATVLVTFIVGLSLLLLKLGKDWGAGIVFAFAVAFKPHLILVLPLMYWHSRRMVVTTLVTGVFLFAFSVAYAGVQNHVDYLADVLPTVSRGYAFYPNQSWNGMLHRLSPDANIASFALAAPSVPVRVGSALLSLSCYVAALAIVSRWRGAPIAPFVFAFAWLVSTLVSPIAWEHHYAPALFLFAMAYGTLREEASLSQPKILALLGVAFVLVASYFEVRHLEGVVPRVLVSYVFVGALCLVAAWALMVNRLVGASMGLASSPGSA